MSYRDLEVWRLARELTIEIQDLSLKHLPRYEMYEVGSQIRRSIKSVRSNIVEGYGRRRYKQEFIRFLSYALSSCDETRDHLDVLFETGSLAADDLYANLAARLDTLGRKLNNLITSVESGHRSVRELLSEYGEDSERAEGDVRHPASSVQHPASVEADHHLVRELLPEYDQEPERAEGDVRHPVSSIQHPASEDPTDA